MTRLSVNVNKIATLRNARGGNVPDLLEVSKDIISFGAAGITLHPRPDGRHIRETDLGQIHQLITALRSQGQDLELNIEGYPDARLFDLLRKYRPEQVTLVPDAPEVLTSNQGWCIEVHEELLREALSEVHGLGIRSSLFVEADPLAVEAAHRVGAHRVELYTGPYAEAFVGDSDQGRGSLQRYILAARRAQELNIGLNAGHDLNLENISPFICAVPQVDEVSIGHALISEALYYGLQNIVGMYLERIQRGFQ